MKLLFTFSFIILTISLSESDSSQPPPPPLPLVSIPLYHRGMLKLNHTAISSIARNLPWLKFSAKILHPLMGAASNLFPSDIGYAVFMWLGTPTQLVLVLMDTVSHFTWTQCVPCISGCLPLPHDRPPFNPGASTTLKELNCESDTCRIPQMRDVFTDCSSTQGPCRFDMKYEDQSHSFGRMVMDILTFVHSNTEVKEFIMGCADSREGPFRNHFLGVLGLGRGPLSVQSQLNAKAFSFCLVSPRAERPSTLDFFDLAPAKEHYDLGSIMVPLSQRDGCPHHYFVQLVGIGINGFMLDIPSRVWGYGLNYDGGVIVDSGSAAMHLPSEAYSVFSWEIRRAIQNFTRKSGAEGLDLCFADDQSNVYPTIELYFENGLIDGGNFVCLELSTDQILIRPEAGVVCFAFGEGTGSALTVIGYTQLQGTRLTYDLANDLLVFTPNKC